MLEILLIALPLAFSAGTLLLKRDSKMPRLFLLTAGLLHLCGCALLACGLNRPLLPDWFAADRAGLIAAGIASTLFTASAIHINFWLPKAAVFESKHGIQMPEKIFCALLLAFLAMMTMAVFSRNLGLLWVAVEATTLFSAPLIIFHRSATSLEAMWKYLLICSVGIALALFGTYLLCVAFQMNSKEEDILALSTLSALAKYADPVWFRAAFLFCFAGYGLKMGLAPFHTWLPDAHSEAPSCVSLLLSGALLNCSFVGIYRVISVAPAEVLPFCREVLIVFGVFSLAVAAFFMIGQYDYKRLLAYSSVEHMGLIAVFMGLNSPDMMFLHMIFHSFCKMLLFLTAGNFLLAYGTRRIDCVQGAGKMMPRTAFLWFAGILMICGMPPSPLFVTEIGLVQAAGPWLGALILLLLFAVFAAMTNTALRMSCGKAVNIPEKESALAAEKLSVLPLVLLAVPVLAGCYLLTDLAGGF